MRIKIPTTSYHMAPANKEVHKIKPIGELLRRYIAEAISANPHATIVDPFARNATLANFTNDISRDTDAAFHMDAADFLEFLYQQGVRADVVIFDPPFSASQNAKAYKVKEKGTRLQDTIVRCKQILPRLVRNGGIVITTGWTANGVGDWRGFDKIEFMTVNHSYNRYATTCLVERKVFEPIHVIWKYFEADKCSQRHDNNCDKAREELADSYFKIP
jgi:hypothetical protein